MESHEPNRLLRSFERYLRAGNRSERTVGNYLESAREAEAFLQESGIRLEGGEGAGRSQPEHLEAVTAAAVGAWLPGIVAQAVLDAN